MANNLPSEKKVLAVSMLVEDSSIRSIERITGIHRDTILKLLVVAGEKCEQLLDAKLRNLQVADIQADEIWAYVGKKEAHKSPEEAHVDTLGDAYTFVGIERNTKLVVACEQCRHKR